MQAGDHPQSPGATASGLYRRVWRWHFFAGLVCLPFILSLAITGALYLFHAQIDDAVYGPNLLRAAAAGSPTLTPGAIMDRALMAYRGHVVAVTIPGDERHNAQVDVDMENGITMQVFVDPATGRVAGALDESSRIMTIIKYIHSLSVAGPAGNVVIEIVAGWVIVLVTTGAYLWWPRGRTAGLVSIRRGARGRLWWRDLHALTGAFGGIVILFLALTGMPWSVFWGQNVNAWMTAHGLGVPAAMWGALPESHPDATAARQLPWTQRTLPVPVSDPHAAHKAIAQHAQGAPDMMNPASTRARAVGVDRIAGELARLGVTGGYRLVLPAGPRGVYSAIQTPGPVAMQRVIHFDQYSSKVLMDIGADRIGPLGRITEWGISVHQGQEYGIANQLVMLGGCLVVIALCISGAVMWWRRRPAGQLAAPARRQGDGLAAGVIVIAVVLGSAFPLLGASMLAMLAFDATFGVMRRRRG